MSGWPGAPTRCSRPAWSTRSSGCWAAGCATACPPPGRWATPRWSPTSTRAAPATPPGSPRLLPPAAMCDGSARGFAGTTASTGSTRPPAPSTTRYGPGGTYPGLVNFAKGHGTQNDFVLLPDMHAELPLTPAAVAALCDRRRGLGADGVLRVTTAGAVLAAGVLDRLPDGVGPGDWYMDYRNADGSVAQMCGNGVRVFAHYLRASGMESRDEFVVGSLAGPRLVSMHHVGPAYADVTVDMGKTNELGVGEAIVAGRPFAGLAIDVGNPHLACVDADLTDEDLAALDVAAPVSFDREQFPDGVNVEILTAPHEGAVSMRVHERGVGETRSCGTGTVAAAVAALAFTGATTGTLTVRVPGGEVVVTITEGTSYLRGPSVLVARGELSEEWWRAEQR